MQKILKSKYTMIAISFLFLIGFSIPSFFNSELNDFNWFEKIVKAPWYEFTYLLNQFLDFRVAYTITFILGIVLVFPVFSYMKKIIVKLIDVYKYIINSKNNAKPNETDEEAVSRVQDMLTYYENNGVSFIEFVYVIVFTFVGTYFLNFILAGAFESSIFTIKNYQFLWFQLGSKDQYYALPILSMYPLYIIPFVKYKYRMDTLKV